MNNIELIITERNDLSVYKQIKEWVDLHQDNSKIVDSNNTWTTIPGVGKFLNLQLVTDKQNEDLFDIYFKYVYDQFIKIQE